MDRYEKLEEQFEAYRLRHDNYVNDVMKEKLTLVAERNKAYKLLEEGRNQSALQNAEAVISEMS